jgi:hypothetical protein
MQRSLTPRALVEPAYNKRLITKPFLRFDHCTHERKHLAHEKFLAETSPYVLLPIVFYFLFCYYRYYFYFLFIFRSTTEKITHILHLFVAPRRFFVVRLLRISRADEKKKKICTKTYIHMGKGPGKNCRFGCA